MDPTLSDIISFLNKSRVRATYGAVADEKPVAASVSRGREKAERRNSALSCR